MASTTHGEVFFAQARQAVYTDEIRSTIISELYKRRHWVDKEFAFVVPARMAMKERPEEALPVILSELQQHLDTPNWHPVRWSSLTPEEKKNVLRSKVFMKDKFTASGAFDKYKARMVAGGNRDDLRSPTIATSHVLTIAALVAKECRIVMTIDIA